MSPVAILLTVFTTGLLCTVPALTQPYYNPCYDDSEDNESLWKKCYKWVGAMCIPEGLPDSYQYGSNCVPSNVPSCWGYEVGGNPDASCGAPCTRRQYQTGTWCEPKTNQLIGTKKDGTVLCWTAQPGDSHHYNITEGCAADCINIVARSGEVIEFPHHTLIDCIDPGE